MHSEGHNTESENKAKAENSVRGFGLSFVKVRNFNTGPFPECVSALHM